MGCAMTPHDSSPGPPRCTGMTGPCLPRPRAGPRTTVWLPSQPVRATQCLARPCPGGPEKTMHTPAARSSLQQRHCWRHEQAPGAVRQTCAGKLPGAFRCAGGHRRAGVAAWADAAEGPHRHYPTIGPTPHMASPRLPPSVSAPRGPAWRPTHLGGDVEGPVPAHRNLLLHHAEAVEAAEQQAGAVHPQVEVHVVAQEPAQNQRGQIGLDAAHTPPCPEPAPDTERGRLTPAPPAFAWGGTEATQTRRTGCNAPAPGKAGHSQGVSYRAAICWPPRLGVRTLQTPCTYLLRKEK